MAVHAPCLRSLFYRRRAAFTCVPARSMATTRAEIIGAEQQEASGHQNQQEDDDPGHPHPAWCAGIGGLVSHVPLLWRSLLSGLDVAGQSVFTQCARMKAKFLWRVGMTSTSLKPASVSIGVSLSAMLSPRE